MSELHTIENYRRFLRADFEGPPDHETGKTDMAQGVPAPAAHKPRPEGATLIDLTAVEDLNLGRMPVAQAIRQRRSRRQYAEEPLTVDELSFLLWATQGLEKSFKRGFELRTVPAGGARHPFETYLSVHRVLGIEPGLYQYDAGLHKLCLLYLEGQIAERFCAARGGERVVKKCAVYFVWTVVPYRKEWVYGFWINKAAAIEAGHVCQNLYLASEAIGCGTCATSVHGQIGPRYDELLGVDGIDEFSVYAAAVGKLRRGREVQWSGQIEGIEADEDLARLTVTSFSWWEGDVFVAEFPRSSVAGYPVGDYVGIRGEIVEMCSEYDGWPLVSGTAIERRTDPDAGSQD